MVYGCLLIWGHLALVVRTRDVRSGDSFFALVRRLRRSQKSAPIAASPTTPRGIPRPSPTFAPVLRPEEFESCCVLPPNDASPPVGKPVISARVTVRSWDMVLRYVLIEDADVD